ncbi:hypothetical protein Syun_020083 [Stephania yunnanensis]|uniref:Transcription factor CBF/NF-Y/archaeal histone domain-containing protein n=1 Tax=Stephania yunnanensis TaxID=152371 RepID=A0AAP0IVB1_9MAGN
MDSNQSLQFQYSSGLSHHQLPQVHNFMQVPPPCVPSPLLPYNQFTHYEVGEGSLESRLIQMERQNLQLFWRQQMIELDQISDFRQHQLPLARIKRVMKSDEDVKMISADAPILFAKACELFILELTLRSWLQTEGNRRRTLQRADIAYALRRGEVYDFLLEVVPKDEMEEEEGMLGMNEGIVIKTLHGLQFKMMNGDQDYQNHNAVSNNCMLGN